jgi:predicted enzyme related to lactoylglutathione lyase
VSYPNTLIFVDLPSTDPEASARFYHEVFGWEVEPRPAGVFHRIVPGDNFLVDGKPGPTGNLHMSREGHTVRVWILVSDDDDADAIMDRAVERGAEELWRHHYWKEFNGFNCAFKDPWGNTLVLWTKGGDDPQIPEGWTGE